MEMHLWKGTRGVTRSHTPLSKLLTDNVAERKMKKTKSFEGIRQLVGHPIVFFFHLKFIAPLFLLSA